MLKRCCKCKLEKNISDFHNSKNSKDGKQNSCKQCKSTICRKYYDGNAENIKSKTNAYYHDNKDKRVAWENGKYHNDPIFKLKKRLRHRLRCALYRLRTHRSRGSAIKDVGCSVEELKKYIESKWQPGMTWDNWGSNGWHIDHIMPLCCASDEEELLKLCHYTNLQPLWKKDHLIKTMKDIKLSKV